MSLWPKVRSELNELVNRQFDTPEFRLLLSVPLNPARLQIHDVHMTHYSNNRRDCWAAVQSNAPLDVKRAIWEHEREELIFDDRIGKAHVTEADLAFHDESRLSPGARALFYAWLYCAREKDWLEGLVYSHILERRNNSQIVHGGGLMERWVKKRVAELGSPEHTVDSWNRVHAVADIEHSDIFEPIFERYVRDETTAESVLRAARDGLVLDRAFRGAISTAMLAEEGSPVP